MPMSGNLQLFPVTQCVLLFVLVSNYAISPSEVKQYRMKSTDDYSVRVVTVLKGDDLNLNNGLFPVFIAKV